MKDCVILETYLDYMRGLRMSSARAAVFVSSNTRDFANDRKNEVATQLRDEFGEVDLKYAPNMRIAHGLLGLLRPKSRGRRRASRTTEIDWSGGSDRVSEPGESIARRGSILLRITYQNV